MLGPLVDLIHFPGSDNPLTMFYYPFLICFIGQSLCVVLIVFFLEETLPPEKRMPMKSDIFNSIKQFSILFTGPKGISEPALFRSLAFILMVNGEPASAADIGLTAVSSFSEVNVRSFVGRSNAAFMATVGRV